MSLTTARELLAHMVWADGRVFEALRADPGSDPRVLEQFGHLLAAEHIWISRLERRPARLPVWPSLTLEECAALSQENLAAYAAFIDRESDDSLARTVDYTNTAGRAYSDRAIDILLHVALHGAYHRGQVARLQRDGGGVPVSTDYIFFKRER
jgi:uncharacterized damage-inducible protein DinB